MTQPRANVEKIITTTRREEILSQQKPQQQGFVVTTNIQPVLIDPVQPVQAKETIVNQKVIQGQAEHCSQGLSTQCVSGQQQAQHCSQGLTTQSVSGQQPVIVRNTKEIITNLQPLQPVLTGNIQSVQPTHAQQVIVEEHQQYHNKNIPQDFYEIKSDVKPHHGI